MKPQTHDEYLQNFSGAIRQTLDEIRALIRNLVPDAEAYIGYGIPAFRLKGKYFHWLWRGEAALRDLSRPRNPGKIS